MISYNEIPKKDLPILIDLTSPRNIEAMFDCKLFFTDEDKYPKNEEELEEWFSDMKSNYLDVCKMDLDLRGKKVHYFPKYMELLDDVFSTVITRKMSAKVREYFGI